MTYTSIESLPKPFLGRHPELAAALAAATGADGVATVDDVERRMRATATGIDRGQIIDALQKLGRSAPTIGRFVVGRRGGKSRFQWLHPAGGIVVVDSPGPAETPVPATSTVADDSAATVGVRHHTFHLRPDFLLHMDLPADLTPREAERLSRFIGSIPLD